MLLTTRWSTLAWTPSIELRPSCMPHAERAQVTLLDVPLLFRLVENKEDGYLHTQ
jgi:hypothetical protein